MLKSLLMAWIRPPITVIVWFMETYEKNRGQLKAFLTRPRVASAFKTAVVVTFLAWLVIFAFFASRQEGDRFTCAVKSLWSGFDRSGCPAQPWEQPAPDAAKTPEKTQ